MSQYDPTALTLDYADRAAETRRSLASSAWAAATGMQVGSIAPGQSDEVYLQIVEELPEAAVDQAGRLLYQRREDANDLLYLGIINDSGDPQWVLVSELQETADEVGLYKWTQTTTSLDILWSLATTGSELLVVETPGTTSANVRRRNLTTGASIGTFGSYGTGNGQFAQPRGIAVSAAGSIHVADSGNSRVVQFNSSRTFVRNIGSFGTGNGNLSGPGAVACDSSNNVYVADTGNDRVAVFGSTGTWLRNIGSAGTGDGQFTSPYGVAVSAAGELYVTDQAQNRVQVFTASTGAYLRTFGTYGSAAGQLNSPSDISVDSDGDVYVADSGNNRIQKFSSTGTYLMQISNVSATGTLAVVGVLADGSNVYATAAISNGRYRPATKLFTVIPAGGVEVAANSAATASARSKLNFINGTGISMSVADDATNLEAEITVAISPTVTIRTASGTVGSTVGALLTVRAACNTGEVAVGGGYSGPGYPNYYVTRPVNSSNGTTGTPTKWEVSVENTVAGQSPAVSAWVVCLAV